MGARIYSVDYYEATVEDLPGEGHRFLTWLAEEQVNLLAFSAWPTGRGRTRLSIYPVNSTWLADAARRQGVRLAGPHHGFIVHGDDTLGSLVDIHRKLAHAGINVATSNGISDGRGGYRYILHVSPEDVQLARKTLGVRGNAAGTASFSLNLARHFEAKEIRP